MRSLRTATVVAAAAIGFAATAGMASAETDLVVVSWGGAYSASQQNAYHEPWMAANPAIRIVNDDSSNEAVAKLRAMNEAGNVTWDLVDVVAADAIRLCDEGLALPVDHDAVLAAAFAPMLPGAAPAEIVLRGGAMAVGLQLAITPVKGRNIPLFANALHGERVAFMVTATALGPSLQNLMALYGLTRAEAEVTLLLTEGLRAPQIALHRETSTATVNTQLKQIYAKTGVDGQIALILKLLGR